MAGWLCRATTLPFGPKICVLPRLVSTFFFALRARSSSLGLHLSLQFLRRWDPRGSKVMPASAASPVTASMPSQTGRAGMRALTVNF